ncbi:unnamed protein product [Parajaminaea phylloscopi]
MTCIARSNYDAVQKAGGVSIQSLKYGKCGPWAPDVLLKEGEESAKVASQTLYDYVIVTAKAVLENKTSAFIRPYLRQLREGETGPTIVLIQNGIGIEDEVARSLIPSHANKVLTCIAWIGANLQEAGTLVEHGELERLEVGLFPSPADKQSIDVSLQAFCDLWNSAGGQAVPYANIQPLRWSKIFWNAAWGGVCVVARQTVYGLLLPGNLPFTLPVVRRIMLEVLAVARSCGIDEDALPASKVDDSIDITFSSRPGNCSRRLAKGFKPSILLDLEAGRPMELQAIIGNCVRLARQNGVDTPRLDMILAALAPNQAIALGREDGLYPDESGQGVPDGWPIGCPL